MMLTYFDSVKAPIIAHAIDLMEAGIITNKTNIEFANDLMAAVLRQYAHYDDKEVQSIR